MDNILDNGLEICLNGVVPKRTALEKLEALMDDERPSKARTRSLLDELDEARNAMDEFTSVYDEALAVMEALDEGGLDADEKTNLYEELQGHLTTMHENAVNIVAGFD